MADRPLNLKNNLDGIAVRDGFLPFHRPWLDEAEESAVLAVLRSGWLTRGDRTDAFEAAFADYTGAPHAIALNSCTSALHLALLAAGAGEGDEVITTPYTFAATANTIVHSGATPVFADIDSRTLNIDPARVAEKITTRTRAIVPVHFGGHPCAMDEIGELADEHGLVVIEDAAHALGATYGGKAVGSISPFTAFSFYASKNITTGEGGMLTVEDPEAAERVRVLSRQGMSSDAWKRHGRDGSARYQVVEPGFKYNMSDLQAALGLEQLKRFDRMQARRRELAAVYDSELDGFPLLDTLQHHTNGRHANHLYVVLLRTGELAVDRDTVARDMGRCNIGVSVHFRALHLHPFYRETCGCSPDDLPQATRASEQALSLPLYPLMSDEDARLTARILKSILEYHARSGRDR